MNDSIFDDCVAFTDDIDPNVPNRPRDAAAHYQPDVRQRNPDLRWNDQDTDEEL